ncbi:sugar ABC transporter substrate-binding protein [Paenibacillus sp. LHD-38]|uniref:ABC transporter substrate-binding protein n=1 Tax=Paenibacillus sp. LHD-38 TaxID=3072143 RepID=UPI00280C65C4|nr:sugar ABC transporter substrate-binding protein [Paenibacillus sp. LHD-38]MDQ8737144.1 sugar ABC transporter substrate-binding protein [Paenibacillus sp. LHD-38]
MKGLKFQFTTILLTLIVAFSTACGNGNGNGGNNSNEPAKTNNSKGETSGGEVTEITFANWISVEDATKAAYEKMIADFETANPGIKVKSLGIPFNQYKDQILISSTGGNPPDVMMANQNFSAAFVGASIAAPLEGLVSADALGDIVEGSKQGVTYDGKIMAFPWAPHPNALFWNKNLFKAAGLDPETPPATWDEMIEVAKKIASLKKDANGNPIYGIGINNASLSYSGNMLFRDVLTYGGTFMNDQGEVVFDQGDALKQALTNIQDLVNNGVAPKGVEIKDLRGMFGVGTLGLHIDGDMARQIFRDASGKGEAFDAEWGVTVVPPGATGKSETVFSEHQLLIAKTSKKQEAAAKLVEYLVSKEAMITYHQLNGVMSARTSVAALPEMNEDDYAAVFNKQMSSASPFPAKNPVFDNAMKTASDMIILVTEGGQTPETAIEQVMPKIKELYVK